VTLLLDTVAGTTVIHLRRGRGMRRKISLLARAGQLIWFTGVIAPSLADARHWPAREIGQVNGVEYACKMTGFALLAADLALRAIAPTRGALHGREAGP
jgi:hypothetical protein